MKLLSVKSSRLESERGTTLIESAIVLPLLVMMVAATYDLGGALNQYLTLTRVVYEGARYAATLPGLELNGVHAAVGNDQNHNKVRSRLVLLLQKNGYQESDFTQISTENTNNEWVSVSLTRQYQSVFGFFNNMPLKVSATGPYLSISAQQGYLF